MQEKNSQQAKATQEVLSHATQGDLAKHTKTQEKQGKVKENLKLLEILQEKFTNLENVRSKAIDSSQDLIEYLLEGEYKDEFKERFFINTAKKGVVVFKKDDFLQFLKLKVRNSSYTAFSNKIGLQLEPTPTQRVVLNFPFKDCVLKGAQSKDEQKSKEIFFNEILAKSEIDVLEDAKVLQNFELIGHSVLSDKSQKALAGHCERSEAIHKVDSSIDCHEKSSDFSRNDKKADSNKQKGLKESLNLGANLLIKGNNLLALHSLKKKFANKVKLIYIDPPYNTGNDSFNYNDNFNHSTWLTFMKNRLEIAREFLRDDGVIFIQCDDNEQAYLKVLCDEIFNGGGGGITL